MEIKKIDDATLFKSIVTTPTSLTDPIIEAIIGLIRSGKLKSGDRLPPQDVIATQLGVSRTSLREALQELAYRGIITSIHGKGTFVSEHFVSNEEIIEARKIIEPVAASLAANKVDEEDRALLIQFIDEMQEKVEKKDLKGFTALDLEFHMKINALSGNRALFFMMRTIRDMLLSQQNYTQRLPGALERAHNYHVKIVQAIINGEGNAAHRIMKEHLDDVMVASA